MKADDKEEFENDEGKMEKEKYSNFEHLKAKVKVLQEHLELISKILKQKGLTKVTEEYELLPDLEDETYKKLEED